MNLRAEIGALIDEGSDIMTAPKAGQSGLAHVEPSEGLAGRTAQRALQKME